MSSLSGIPGGDPGSAAFPAQLDATVEAVEDLVPLRFASLSARATAYAAAGKTPIVGHAFALDEDPGALYVVTAADLDSWAVHRQGQDYVTGQVRVDWPSAGGIYSVASWVPFPAGSFTGRPIVLLTTINGASAGPAVMGCLSKNLADEPSSEVTVDGFGIQLFTVNHESGFAESGSARFRYAHFRADARTSAGVTATPMTG